MDYRSEMMIEAMNALDKIWIAGVSKWILENKPTAQRQIDFAEARLDSLMSKDSVNKHEFKIAVDAWKSAQINALNLYRREHGHSNS